MPGQYSDITNLERVRLTEMDFNVIRDISRGIYVEVGTFHGASAYAASFNAHRVWTIDIYHWEPHIWKKLLPRDNIIFFKGTSEDWKNQAIKEASEHGFRTDKMINVLFIDGSHEYDYVKRDIAALCPLVKSGGWVLFHDYHPQSPGVKPAVDEWLATITPKQIIQPIPGICKILQVQV